MNINWTQLRHCSAFPPYLHCFGGDSDEASLSAGKTLAVPEQHATSQCQRTRARRSCQSFCFSPDDPAGPDSWEALWFLETPASYFQGDWLVQEAQWLGSLSFPDFPDLLSNKPISSPASGTCRYSLQKMQMWWAAEVEINSVSFIVPDTVQRFLIFPFLCFGHKLWKVGIMIHNLMDKETKAQRSPTAHGHLFCSVAKSCPTLQPHGLQHSRIPCPSLSPVVCSNSCPISLWCHAAISSSVVPFSSCPQSFLGLGSFPVISCSHQVAKILDLTHGHTARFIWCWALYFLAIFKVIHMTLGNFSFLSGIFTWRFSPALWTIQELKWKMP